MIEKTNIRALEELLLLAQCGDATERQIDELNDLLRNDAGLRVAATRFLQFDAMLQEEISARATADQFTSSPPPNEIPLRLVDAATLAPHLMAPPRSELPPEPSRLSHAPMANRNAWSDGSGRFVTWLLATAVVAFVATSISFLLLGRNTNATRTTDTDESPTTAMRASTHTPFAVLVQTHDCVWVGGSEHFEGQRLSAGTLELKSGLAEIRLDSGISAILQGPAAIDLLTSNHAVLQFGSVVVEGAGADISLRLGTPQGEIVDIGTRYSAVVARGQDSTEIHVFDGTVLVHRQDREDSDDP